MIVGMRNKLIIGIVLFTLACADLFYWFYYCNQNEMSTFLSHSEFISNYKNSLPSVIRPLYESNFPTATILVLFMFVISGVIFLMSKQMGYKILGIIAFVFAALELFGLM